MIAAIILAAGDSRRMGSPKALLEFRGETFAERLVRIFSGFCDPVVMVLGRHADAIRARVHSTTIVNPDPDRGQLSSLQTALAALPEALEAFFFIPVDCPAIEANTIATLIREFRTAPAPFVIPRYGGRRGHPVCVAGWLAQEFLAMPPTAETRAVVNRHESAIRYLDLDDPGVLIDVDDPEAYRALAK